MRDDHCWEFSRDAEDAKVIVGDDDHDLVGKKGHSRYMRADIADSGYEMLRYDRR